MLYGKYFLIVFLLVCPEVYGNLRSKRSSGWLWSSGTETDESEVTAVAAETRKGASGQRGFLNFEDWTTEEPDDEEEVVTTPKQSENCTCVPSYECDEDQVVTYDDDDDQDDRRRTGTSQWLCPSLLVCCRIPKTNPTTTTTKKPTTVIPGYKPRCGNLNPNGVNARVLGFKESETQFGEYPSMSAILQIKKESKKISYQFLCGGTLIWPSVIITAYHCVYGKRIKDLRIRVGEWDTTSTNEFYPHQDVGVREVVGHPEYYGGSLYNDLALIFLSKPLVLAPHVDTACLPLQDRRWYDNVTCWATGWGKNAFGPDGAYQVILKEVKLPIVPRAACQEALRKTNLGSGFKLHKSFLCAGGLSSQDTCVGDGGGPLICASSHDPWRYILAGVTSWGIGCGNYGVPGAYSDTALFRDWIDKTISTRISTYDKDKVSITPITGKKSAT